jgi:serine/threonine-protein kinase HipA
MSVAGKRDAFTIEDLRECARTAAMKRGSAERILTDVMETIAGWQRYAEDAGVGDEQAAAIGRTHRLRLPAG